MSQPKNPLCGLTKRIQICQGKRKWRKQCPLKNKFYFELHRMIVFYNYVFDWLFGLSFHKCREWMWCNMDVYIRSVSSFVLSFLFWTLYSLPWWKLFFHSKSSEYLKLEFSSSYQEFLRLCSDFWRQSSFFFFTYTTIYWRVFYNSLLRNFFRL